MKVLLNKYGAGLVLLFLLLGLSYLPKASHDREWRSEQGKLSFVRMTEGSEEVKITQIRDFGSENKYINRAYNLAQLEGADVIAGDFSMTRFRFQEAENLVFSLQPRLEADESYTSWKTYLPFYEVYSLISTESDILKSDPIITQTLDKTQARELFFALAASNNQLFEKARFYNALWHK